MWNYNCDYKGINSDTRTGVRSFLRCGEACVQLTNCTFFTLDLKTEICYLKTLAGRQVIFESAASICGEIPDRIFTPTGGRNWTFSEDKFMKWSTNCTFKEAVPLNLTANGINSVSDCGQMCKANANCNHFHLNQNKCILNKALGRVQVTADSIGTTCGFIPVRLYNEEFITKCNFTNVY